MVFGLATFAYLVGAAGGLRVGVDLNAYLLAGDNLLAGREVYWGQLRGVDAFYMRRPGPYCSPRCRGFPIWSCSGR